ncbi:unnamed protein product [Cylicocyclus nassatus]|uniref:glucuronosyltransferase n=1 Tax=Cylicocyclus nassatus TaxID=53992 RepID=A0AA36M8Y2_CYLNA|nr:unnamed protein product [Cylicocyclus nassatus]
MNTVVLILCLYHCVFGYNYLVYSPLFGHSHAHFMGTIADTLTDAGHNVTVLMPVLDPDMENMTGLKLTANVIKVPANNKTAAMFAQKAEYTPGLWNLDPSAYGMVKLASGMAKGFTLQCEKVLNDDNVMSMLRSVKFDVGISEAFGICGFGIFELLGVKSTIAAASMVQADHVSKIIGLPLAPSYVPGSMYARGEVRSVLDRLRNVLETQVGAKFNEILCEMETAPFRAKYGKNFKGCEELLGQISYLFTNSNPYLDYPRPTIHKAVDIGGIAASLDAEKNKLPQHLDKILDIRSVNVVISFGSVVKSCYMPENYRQSLLKVFKTMPNVTFIWKYELDASQDMFGLANVYLSEWLPQVALLADPRVTAFISHGGLGSTTEIAHMGKPAIMVPLFADQTRNANMLARHGGALVLDKYGLADHFLVRETIQKIITDESYATKARLLADILVNQPISAKTLMIQHAEFAARFGRIPNLDSQGRHLSILQHYLIDVFTVVLAVLAITLSTIYYLLRICWRWRVSKAKLA